MRAEPAGETGDTASITLLSALLVPGDTFTAEESVCRTSPEGDPAKKAKKSKTPSKKVLTEEKRVGNRQYARPTLSKERKNLAFHGVDACTKALRYWDDIRCAVYDQAYEHANIIKQMVNLIQDKQKKGKCLFNDISRRRNCDQE